MMNCRHIVDHGSLILHMYVPIPEIEALLKFGYCNTYSEIVGHIYFYPFHWPLYNLVYP